ncbi:N-acetylmuramoyl-L-alanine amidase [Limnochorda pilosa]|uniref:MurNAc-LAA domain-containing protein n=1 Tax=Limnochorda pilosa TaxID=1555112 RepID=A0A0K2SJH0_LIMPI|nr:N-acetylmuramoyl-L-alanine amidase [Limnochorda pilosa]BAS27152.1 hypothetical protein LIP_1295 [Limnochorda pilosa]
MLALFAAALALVAAASRPVQAEDPPQDDTAALRVVRVLDGRPAAPFQFLSDRLRLTPTAEQPDPDALLLELPSGQTTAARTYREDGIQYLDLVSLATALGMRLDWDPSVWGFLLRPRHAARGAQEIALLPEGVFDGLGGPVSQAQLTTVEERGPEAAGVPYPVAWHTPSGQESATPPQAPRPEGTRPGKPEEEASQVLGLRVLTDGGMPRVQVEAAAPVSHRSILLANPARLVIDLAPARLEQSLVELPADQDVVKSVRASQFEPGVVRVVLDLTHPTGYRVARTSDSRVIQAELDEHVSGYALWRENDRFYVGLDATGKVPLQVRPLREPDRLVVDMQGATVTRELSERPQVEGVRSVRLSQFQPHVARLVVEFESQSGAALPKAAVAWSPEGGGPVEISEAMQLVWLNHVEQLRTRLSGSWLYLAVEAEDPMTLETLQLSGPQRLVFDIPGAVLPRDLAQKEWSFTLDGRDGRQDEQVTVRAGQFSAGRTRLVVESRDPLEYQAYRLEGQNRMVIGIASPRVGGRLVVLDPGHGGLDRGAGDTDLSEKLVNLDIASRLGEALKRRGFEIAMTRSDDTFIPLWERAALANALSADLFVSIHSNAAVDGAAEGIETYYLPKQPNNQILAQAVQRELVRTLRRKDRGVKSNNFWVLRDAEVPAILVEVSFITNPQEKELLGRETYRKEAAEAVATGIVQYFARLDGGPVPASASAAGADLWNRVMHESREAEDAKATDASI